MIAFQKIEVKAGDEIILWLSSEREAVKAARGEAILDVNGQGNWIRGLELISGFIDFPLGKALKPFDPIRPFPPGQSRPPGTVTLDYEEGDELAFLYLLYGDTFIHLPEGERTRLLKVDQSIMNPNCEFGLDAEGGLVWVKLPMADLSAGPEALLALLKK